jgi:hypothetical protein
MQQQQVTLETAVRFGHVAEGTVRRFAANAFVFGIAREDHDLFVGAFTRGDVPLAPTGDACIDLDALLHSDVPAIGGGACGSGGDVDGDEIVEYSVDTGRRWLVRAADGRTMRVYDKRSVTQPRVGPRAEPYSYYTTLKTALAQPVDTPLPSGADCAFIERTLRVRSYFVRGVIPPPSPPPPTKNAATTTTTNAQSLALMSTLRWRFDLVTADGGTRYELNVYAVGPDRRAISTESDSPSTAPTTQRIAAALDDIEVVAAIKVHLVERVCAWLVAARARAEATRDFERVTAAAERAAVYAACSIAATMRSFIDYRSAYATRDEMRAALAARKYYVIERRRGARRALLLCIASASSAVLSSSIASRLYVLTHNDVLWRVPTATTTNLSNSTPPPFMLLNASLAASDDRSRALWRSPPPTSAAAATSRGTVFDGELYIDDDSGCVCYAIFDVLVRGGVALQPRMGERMRDSMPLLAHIGELAQTTATMVPRRANVVLKRFYTTFAEAARAVSPQTRGFLFAPRSGDDNCVMKWRVRGDETFDLYARFIDMPSATTTHYTYWICSAWRELEPPNAQTSMLFAWNDVADAARIDQYVDWCASYAYTCTVARGRQVLHSLVVAFRFDPATGRFAFLRARPDKDHADAVTGALARMQRIASAPSIDELVEWSSPPPPPAPPPPPPPPPPPATEAADENVDIEIDVRRAVRVNGIKTTMMNHTGGH